MNPIEGQSKAAIPENDANSNENDEAAGNVPLRRRRRLGLPTRRRRPSIVTNNVVASPSRRPRIEKDINVEINVGTAVTSPEPRWNLPASTMFRLRAL